MPSIKDVARLADVSYTTVSHVINRTRPVAPGTARRVEDAIARLGFVPNRTARGLRKGDTRTVGIITTSPEDVFFMEAMHGAYSVFRKENYDLYFSFSNPEEGCGVDHDYKREIELINTMISRGVEAFIVNSISGDRIIRECIERTGKPFALFQRSIPGTNSCTVVSDDFSGGYRAVSHLASLGRKRIAVFYGWTYPSHAAVHRRAGAEKALRDAGLPSLPELWVDGKYDASVAYTRTVELLKTNLRPDAVFYYSDTLALAGLRAAADCGVKVPEELAIVGYDNIVQCGYSVPRLTSVNQRKFDLGSTMAELLLRRIHEPSTFQEKVVLPVDLIIRESSDPGHMDHPCRLS